MEESLFSFFVFSHLARCQQFSVNPQKQNTEKRLFVQAAPKELSLMVTMTAILTRDGKFLEEKTAQKWRNNEFQVSFIYKTFIFGHNQV